MSYRSQSSALCIKVLLFLITSSIQAIWCQQVTATISGLVTDPSGAVIPEATVTATDSERGTTFAATTNAKGWYDLPVPIGTYRVTIKHQGFIAAELPSITLELEQVARIDIKLEVGSESISIEVEAAAPLLQSGKTEVGTVMDAHAIENLPLATRNPSELILFTPGAITTSPGAFNTGLKTFNSGRPYLNGNREQANHYLLDGIDNNEFVDNNVAYSPNVDAIEEFKIITSNPSAEFGHFLGGVISVSTKAGTNQFRGSAFEFIRNEFFNANEWFRNFSKNPAVNSLPPKLRWNEFGATLGGPIKKDKLFFFVDYQGSRYDRPATVGSLAGFSSQNAKGNLSDVRAIKLHYPGTTVPMPADLTQAAICGPTQMFGVSPCINGLSQTALKILAVLPKPELVSTPNGTMSNLSNSERTFTNGDQGDLKVDWLATSGRIFGRYSQQHVEQPTINSQPLLYNSSGNNIFPLQSGVVDYTKTIGSRLANDVRIGVSYFPVEANVQNLGTVDASGLIPGQPTSFLPGLYFTGSPAGGSQNGPFAFGTVDAPEIRHLTEIQFSDTTTIERGKHLMRAGLQFERYRDNYIPATSNDGAAGQIGFNGQYTGNAEADFLLGLPSYMGYGKGFTGTVGQRNSAIGAFWQDDWRITAHLVLNAGIRWQLFTPVYEVHDRMTNFSEVSGQVQLAGLNGNSRALYDQYNGIANFLPRLGVAWTTLDSRAVVRAAFSRSSFQEGTGEYNRLATNSPWNLDLVSQPTAGTNGAIPADQITLDQGFAALGSGGSGCSVVNVTSAPSPCFAGVRIHLTDPHYRPTVSNQWNLSIQRQFGKSVTVQVAYVGQHSDHLADILFANQKLLLANGTTSPGPYLSGNSILKNEIGQARLNETNAIQNYDGLELSAQKRWGGGLQFALNYTWSKCLTDSMGYYARFGDQTASQASADKNFQEDAYNRRLDYGLCDHDVTNAFNGYVSYDLPFGHGRPFGQNVVKTVDALFGGWAFNAGFIVHGGFPISIYDFSDPSGTGSAEPRPDCIATSRQTPYKNFAGGGYIWFDPTTMAHPALGHLGNCSVSSERGPGLRQINLSLNKYLARREKQSLELRMEAINAFNTPLFTIQAFSTDVFGGSSFGVINTSLGARNLQFGLKYRF